MQQQLIKEARVFYFKTKKNNNNNYQISKNIIWEELNKKENEKEREREREREQINTKF